MTSNAHEGRKINLTLGVLSDERVVFQDCVRKDINTDAGEDTNDEDLGGATSAPELPCDALSNEADFL